MDEAGQTVSVRRFKTSEVELIKALQAIEAVKKYLALEECSIAGWLARTAKDHVDDVLISDPKHNALISQNATKGDQADAIDLCRLLRLGELKRVYHAESDVRALFKATAQHYLMLRDEVVGSKQRIKAVFRQWGIVDMEGETVYGQAGRTPYLEKVPHVVVRHHLDRLYALMDETERLKEAALTELKQLGRSHSEIREFKKIPGIGPVNALVFDALIQTPYRFANKQCLWRYCRLGIADRTSDNTPLGYKRLDRAGIGELKALSYRAWLSALRSDNEVRQFYGASLRRTHNHVHARLNTQRKILAVMLGIWRKGDRYRPELFLGSSNA